MSPRLTPQELRMANERKRKEEEEMLRGLRIARKQEIETKIKWEQMSSELDGLYEELDKIYKKAPQEQISELTVENVNQLIKDAKEIVKEDPYVERSKEFIPAGDNPEYRDAIVVLKQLRQGLDRFKRGYIKYESLDDLVVQLEEFESEEE